VQNERRAKVSVSLLALALLAAGRAQRALHAKSSPACAKTEAAAGSLIRRVSVAFGRDWATTARVLGQHPRGIRRRGKRRTSLPGLAAQADAARDLAIHGTAHLVAALRASC
jgi:hypothetical protein